MAKILLGLANILCVVLKLHFQTLKPVTLSAKKYSVCSTESHQTCSHALYKRYKNKDKLSNL